MYKLVQLLAHEVCVYERLCSMSTTVDLGKVIGPQGPQGAQGPQGPQGPKGPQGDSYITKYVVNSSNKSVTLPQGVYAVQTSVSGREQIIVKLSGGVRSLSEHKDVTGINYGIAMLSDITMYMCDLFTTDQNTATAARAQGTSSVTFYKIA